MFDIFKPLEWMTDFIIYRLCGFAHNTQYAESLHFFIYDTIKIFILILLISFIAGLIKSYFTPEKTRKFLSGKHSGLGNLIAAGLGIVTPFCSCSAVPLFIGFIEAGIPLGITFSFLIAAPMINEVAIIVLWGLFGFKVTTVYIFSGLIIAVISGFVIGLLRLEKYIEQFVYEKKLTCCCSGAEPTFQNRITDARNSALNIFKKTYPFILFGVGLELFYMALCRLNTL